MTHTILVVEDERSLLEVIKRKLEGVGFSVETACTVAEAHGRLKAPVAAVWLDHYLLGEGTGMDVVPHLKRDVETRGIPVFVVSNTVSPDKVQSYLRFGAVKYYTKADHRLDEILADIQTALGLPSRAAA
jgi:CheY-like chemotaxis protein